MKLIFKNLVIGTPLENPLRACVQKGRSVAQRARRLFAPKGINEIYDEETLAVMKSVLREDSNCVDVGCHQGDFLRDFCRLAPQGAHFAFEPLPHLFAKLKEEFGALKNVRLSDSVLSDQTGLTSFQHVVSNPAFSGVRQRAYPREKEQIEVIEVGQNPMDDLIPDDMPIDFIKIDVEGAELQVLRGAVRTIARCRPTIVFEHGVGAADHYGTRPENVFDLLCNDCGLQVFLMREWLNLGAQAALSRERFVHQFNSGENYYFMACPTSRLTK